MFGRCRSGRRWFWQAFNSTQTNVRFHQTNVWTKIEEHGFEDTEEAAWASACAAVVHLANGQPATAAVVHRCVSEGLKELNAAKRAARPAPDTSDAHVVEYLYGYYHGGEKSHGWPVRFRITKKTAKLVFYVRHEEMLNEHGEPVEGIEGNDYGIGYVGRQKLEAEGFVYNRRASWASPEFHLYATFEGMMQALFGRDIELPDLTKLKAEMAAAHPDKGGSNAAFIEARARYVAARRLTRTQQSRSL
jgi:hypothetical protein